MSTSFSVPSGTTYDPEDVTQFFLRMGIAAPSFEHKFHPSRDWRFDLCWPEKKIALEVHGGIFTGGRHNTPAGFLKDMEKENAAAILGWRILKTTPRHLTSFGTAAMLKEILK